MMRRQAQLHPIAVMLHTCVCSYMLLFVDRRRGRRRHRSICSINLSRSLQMDIVSQWRHDM